MQFPPLNGFLWNPVQTITSHICNSSFTNRVYTIAASISSKVSPLWQSPAPQQSETNLKGYAFTALFTVTASLFLSLVMRKLTPKNEVLTPRNGDLIPPLNTPYGVQDTSPTQQPDSPHLHSERKKSIKALRASNSFTMPADTPLH